MIRIKEIVRISKTKNKVILENDYILPLYQNEVRRYKLTEGAYIEESDIEKIISDVLVPRAKNRALYLITSSPKTEKQLTEKLKEQLYCKDVIDEVVAFLNKYDYLNDYIYTENYFSQNISKKGINRIKTELAIKGIKPAIITNVIEENDFDCSDTLVNIIEQRKNRYDFRDKKDLDRFIAFLCRRGFTYSQVKTVLADCLKL